MVTWRYWGLIRELLLGGANYFRDGLKFLLRPGILDGSGARSSSGKGSWRAYSAPGDQRQKQMNTNPNTECAPPWIMGAFGP